MDYVSKGGAGIGICKEVLEYCAMPKHVTECADGSKQVVYLLESQDDTIVYEKINSKERYDEVGMEDFDECVDDDVVTKVDALVLKLCDTKTTCDKNEDFHEDKLSMGIHVDIERMKAELNVVLEKMMKANGYDVLVDESLFIVYARGFDCFMNFSYELVL
ncbi:hypothetical protein GOP47_0019080 [Adiantum capillus-veneris]|uniref:Uncharacterized protein n=1 Tax=Adiantum capillus-veneris TaxID=13818 RepID=A0A9D4UEG3_ADICA|nr:hypothetical protein GOP47_0019080 [Adiantum capillus-veneris]